MFLFSNRMHAESSSLFKFFKWNLYVSGHERVNQLYQFLFRRCFNQSFDQCLLARYSVISWREVREYVTISTQTGNGQVLKTLWSSLFLKIRFNVARVDFDEDTSENTRFQRDDPVHPRCGNRSCDHPARLSRAKSSRGSLLASSLIIGARFSDHRPGYVERNWKQHQCRFNVTILSSQWTYIKTRKFGDSTIETSARNVRKSIIFVAFLSKQKCTEAKQ